MVESAFPIITTPDLTRSLRFYVDLLGGEVSYRFPEEGPPAYVGLDLGSSHVGIGEDVEIDTEGAQRFSLWVYVDDCDATIAVLAAAGTPVLEQPKDQPWGERVARVEDPDGNVVILGSRSE